MMVIKNTHTENNLIWFFNGRYSSLTDQTLFSHEQFVMTVLAKNVIYLQTGNVAMADALSDSFFLGNAETEWVFFFSSQYNKYVVPNNMIYIYI